MGLFTAALVGAFLEDERNEYRAQQQERKKSQGPRLPSSPAAEPEQEKPPGPSPASEKFLRDLLGNRLIPDRDGRSGEARAAFALQMLDAGRMSQREVSLAIDKLKVLPRKGARPKDGSPSVVGHLPTAEELPTGRYAIENAEGELRFYRLWRGTRNPDYVEIHVQHGPEESKVPWSIQGYRTLMQSIIDAGAFECARRYAWEIGDCSICGLRLTNKLSRELGIGPVCGGRFFDPGEWRGRKADARKTIRDRGEDPNETVDVGDPRPMQGFGNNR